MGMVTHTVVAVGNHTTAIVVGVALNEIACTNENHIPGRIQVPTIVDYTLIRH